MKKIVKKILVIPLYGIYYIFFEWILGVGMKDPWDKLWEWTKR